MAVLTCADLDPKLSGLLWMTTFVSAALVLTVPHRPAVLMLILSTIIRLMFSIGLEPMLILLGSLNVRVILIVNIFLYNFASFISTFLSGFFHQKCHFSFVKKCKFHQKFCQKS